MLYFLWLKRLAFGERREIESLILNRLSFFCEKGVSIYENIAKCSILVYIFTMADEHDGTNEDRKPWDQMEGESSLWYGRFRAYLHMGFKRSVNAVFHQEVESNGDDWRNEIPGNWYDYAKQFKWQERAKAYDAGWIEEQDKLIAQERERVLRSGFAIQHKRIESLDRILNKLIDMLEDDNNIWMPDVKAIGNGPHAERVDIVNFNAPLFTLIRGYNADIAAEMGERVKKKEVAITELPPNVYLGFDPDEDGSVTQEKEEKDE